MTLKTVDRPATLTLRSRAVSARAKLQNLHSLAFDPRLAAWAEVLIGRAENVIRRLDAEDDKTN